MNEYLFIYLVGCLFAFLLILIKSVVGFFLAWLFKGNIFQKNLKKIQSPPDERTFIQKALVIIGTLLFESLLSWINVIVALWQILAMLFRVIRETLVSVPEEIKQLRFPLINNPGLSREAVWAYWTALAEKAGDAHHSHDDLYTQLMQLKENYRWFNEKDALRRLASLNVVDPEAIEGAASSLSQSDDDLLWED